MGQVNITLENGQLGATKSTQDGIAGMVLTGQTDTGGYTLGTPILITSVADLATNGITLSANPFVYKTYRSFTMKPEPARSFTCCSLPIH